MRRFWFEFSISDYQTAPPGIGYGCGITAYDHADALQQLNTFVIKGCNSVEIKSCIEDVDVSTLDQGHVLPNMAQPNLRGVWFPLGYQQ